MCGAMPDSAALRHEGAPKVVQANVGQSRFLDDLHECLAHRPVVDGKQGVRAENTCSPLIGRLASTESADVLNGCVRLPVLVVGRRTVPDLEIDVFPPHRDDLADSQPGQHGEPDGERGWAGRYPIRPGLCPGRQFPLGPASGPAVPRGSVQYRDRGCRIVAAGPGLRST